MKLTKKELLTLNKLLIEELTKEFMLEADRDLEYEIILQDIKNKVTEEILYDNS